MITVAALYIDPKGPYPGLPGVVCWDEKRNAKCYLGPHPVVAHPPCGPWGRLKFLCKHQDPACGRCAVRQVRKFGGVLEHPQHSSLWAACGLPRPGEPPDAFGGYTVEVRQVWWGHCCEKLTWLYLVGTPPTAIEEPPLPKAEATHRVTNGSRGKTWLPRCSAFEARATPPLFAAYLVRLARASCSSPPIRSTH